MRDAFEFSPQDKSKKRVKRSFEWVRKHKKLEALSLHKSEIGEGCLFVYFDDGFAYRHWDSYEVLRAKIARCRAFKGIPLKITGDESC